MSKDFRRLVDVRVVNGEILTSISCTPAELFGIVGELVHQLATASGGQLEYNQILEDLKEVEGE